VTQEPPAQERLIADLRARVTQAAKGATDAILSQEALVLARELWGAAAEPTADLEVLHVVGWLHWFRFQALGIEHGQEDMDLALVLFPPLYRRDPQLVPPRVQQYFQLNPPPDPDSPAVMAGRAAQLLEAAGSNDLGTLDVAVTLLRRSIAATPPDHPHRAGRLANLAVALQTRFARTQNTADLTEAIDIGEQAVAATTVADPDRAGYLSNLAISLRRRYRQTEDLADLTRLVDVAKQAVAATPEAAPEWAGRQSDLGEALRVRFQRTGVLADLEQAVDLAERAVAATSAGDRGRAGRMANLSDALRIRFEQTGDGLDLERAVGMAEQAVAAAGTRDPVRADCLSSLALALRIRFEQTGVLTDADRAIQAGRQAVEITPADDPDRAGYLSDLGPIYQRRFAATGQLADLDQAVDVLEQGAAISVSSVQQSALLSNLGSALRRRFERSGALTDLDRAIDVGQQAVRNTPASDPDRPGRLSNLARALRIRFDQTGALADLEQAVAIGEQAVATMPADHPDRIRFLSNLRISLQARFARTGDPADLERAVSIGEQVVVATPAERPESAGYLLLLGVDLLTRFRRGGARADLTRAIAVNKAAAAIPTAPTVTRTIGAAFWGGWSAAAEDWSQAVEGFAAAVDLLALLAPRSLARRDQEYQLAEVRGLAGLGSQAAACCLNQGRVDQAVELWEQGRGVLFSQSLDTRTDLTRLREHHPRLAERFTQLRGELDQEPDINAVAKEQSQASDGLDRRRSQAEQFDRLLSDIRCQPGFADFLRPLPASQLLLAAQEGPIVLVNPSNIRSDALILTRAGIELVPLPNLSRRTVDLQTTTFLATLQAAQDPTAGMQARAHAEEQLSGLLGWLWDTVAAPVLGRLGITGKPAADQRWPRLWWCPSGPLAFMPLHAAGYHSTRFEAAPNTVIDRVVSSYTPTIRALIYARRRHRTDETPDATARSAGRVLTIAMPHTPLAGDLPGAGAEATLLKEQLAEQALVLEGPQATYTRVTKALPGYPWAHFACHGTSDLTDPSNSHMLLHDHQDHPLTVLDVTRLRLERPELAFLSACSTARTGEQLPDEAIHLAAAFQLAGYRHVIATLWPIDDRDAVRVARHIYGTLAAAAHGGAGTPTAAQALHNATRRLRAIRPDSPSAWAAHIHNGA
jgi:tetratricopeptide (TPR) repeat protein